MKYSEFSNIQGKVSKLGFGLMRLPKLYEGKEDIDFEEAEKLVDLAYKNGVNYFDTAYVYHAGESEIFAGKILNKYPRESYNLATKLPGWAIKNDGKTVDELFNDYLRRPGFVEPLAAKFCNCTTVTCEGLSQWGSQNLAQQGYNANQIIRSYYGNVETVVNAPIRGNTSSYPGTPLRVGSSGPNVVVIQTELNRISQNYPAIPKIPVVDGIFGPQTESAVRKFQEVFNLTPDGIVGKATWYALVRLYTAVTRLGELRSQGQQFYAINWSPPGGLQPGDTGEKVRLLQYMLSVLSEYIPEIPSVAIDGVYGSATRAAVLAAQRRFRLPETGTVGTQTWNEIYDQYSGIENTTLRSGETFPTSGQNSPAVRAAANMRRSAGTPNRPPFNRTTTLAQFPGEDLTIGSQDPVRQEVVR